VIRGALIFFLVVLFAVLTLATPQNYMGLRRNSNEPLPTLNLITGASEQVVRGAELYDWHCAVCHGPTALGFEEAKLAFPENHRDCQSCHRSNNPSTRANMQGNDNERETFSIGVAPTLRHADGLLTFSNAGVLYAYIQGAMPRYEPGKLSKQEALDITAFLLALRGLEPDHELTEENAISVPLSSDY
jgi:mono/diheme cytochrome c family protein